ncbi:hypothetical protein BDR05DRAFT_761604 [Suillus weaverae]|nr:hypothetical protein BDR05DRAFT_761604 [Suillus weaverae]
MSQAPQLLACFLFPAQVECIKCFPSNLKDNLNLAHTQRTMWTFDPTRQLLSLLTCSPLLHFVISTSIFFELDFFEGIATEIPWKHWGPSNSRVFRDNEMFDSSVGGSRVLKAIPTVETADDDLKDYRLHMIDFSPLAVKHRQGIGQVVREPSTVDLEGELVTTSLPYVEVVSDATPSHHLTPSWVDEDRIYVIHTDTESVDSSMS